jgi:uncharacterized protein YbaP (TraB family)
MPREFPSLKKIVIGSFSDKECTIDANDYKNYIHFLSLDPPSLMEGAESAQLFHRSWYEIAEIINSFLPNIIDNSLVGKTATLKEAHPRNIEKRAFVSQSSIELAFWMQVAEKVKKRIESSSFAGEDRLIYQIQLENQFIGYLIGTLHETNQDMAMDPKLHETVKKCNYLFGEVDFNTIRVLKGGSVDSIDYELMKTAMQKQISCEGLETLLAQKMAFTKIEELSVHNDLFSFQDKKTELLYYYQNCNEEGIDRLNREQEPQLYDIMVAKRNQEWLYGTPNLVHRLKNSSVTPVGIVVGAGHCVGEEGLVIQLRKAGFVVTKEEG